MSDLSDVLNIPPNSIASESALLGALLLDNSVFDRLDGLCESDFYRAEHRLIFGAISNLCCANLTADVVTVFERIQSGGKSAEVGGLQYINQLAAGTPGGASARQYVRNIVDMSRRRQLISLGHQISSSAFSLADAQVAEIIDGAEHQLSAIAQGGTAPAGFKTADNLLVEVIDHVQQMADREDEITGLATGFFDLDRMLSGMQAGDVFVLAARPSMGKSSMARNISEHVALSCGKPVLMFSLEVGARQIMQSVLGSIGRIDQMRLRTGRLHQEEWPRMTEAVEKLRGVCFDIDESLDLRAATIRTAARKAKKRNGSVSLIVVDYLQLITSSSQDKSTNDKVAEISRAMKSLAREMDCPVLLLSQLNRAVEQRGDKRPLMSDLRDSGAVEQDADVVAFIYRDDYYNPNSTEPGVAELIVAKNRNGPTGTIKLLWQKTYTRFENLSRQSS